MDRSVDPTVDAACDRPVCQRRARERDSPRRGRHRHDGLRGDGPRQARAFCKRVKHTARTLASTHRRMHACTHTLALPLWPPPHAHHMQRKLRACQIHSFRRGRDQRLCTLSRSAHCRYDSAAFPPADPAMIAEVVGFLAERLFEHSCKWGGGSAHCTRPCLPWTVPRVLCQYLRLARIILVLFLVC